MTIQTHLITNYTIFVFSFFSQNFGLFQNFLFRVNGARVKKLSILLEDYYLPVTLKETV